LPKVAIIDYGLGNLRSIQKGLETAGANTVITHVESEISETDALILPGVGAFEDAIKNLKPLLQIVLDEIKSGKPLLGVCLGLQLLFTESTEGGLRRGLDIFKGKVVKFSKMKTPHIGWNTLRLLKPDSLLFEGVPDNSFVYFVHSYYAEAEDVNDVITTTEYGINFPSSLSKKNVFATQFHPEKSGRMGLRILSNFIKNVRT
jgi:glutamine amidotransferase